MSALPNMVSADAAAAPIEQMLRWLDVLKTNTTAYLALWQQLMKASGCDVAITVKDGTFVSLIVGTTPVGDVAARLAQAGLLVHHLKEAGHREALVQRLHSCVREVQA